MDNRCSPVYFKLVDYLSLCQHHDANYDIAISLMEHIDEFPDIFIEQIAFYAHTSLSTVTKFSKRLGYPSFKALKEDIIPYVSDHPIIKNTLDSFINRDSQITKEYFNFLDWEDLKKKLIDIMSYHPIVILNSAYSDPFSNHLRSTFESYQKKSFILNRDVDEGVLFDLVKQRGILIIISLTGSWLKKHQELLEKLQLQEIPFYIITAKDAYQEDRLLSLPPLSSLFRSYYHSSRYLSLLGIAIEMTLNEIKAI